MLRLSIGRRTAGLLRQGANARDYAIAGAATVEPPQLFCGWTIRCVGAALSALDLFDFDRLGDGLGVLALRRRERGRGEREHGS